MIGVIGGMGPLATADFFGKVIASTPAEGDEEHVPLLISSDPRIPSRPGAILGSGRSPLPRLLEIRDRLVDAGASALVMPCNTAHLWHADLLRDCPVPFPSIVEIACDAAAGRSGPGARIALVATRATLTARLFEPALAARDRVVRVPGDALLDEAVLPAIAHVKAGRLALAGRLMAQAVRALLDEGADVVLLACTEAPIALAAAGDAHLEARTVDTTLTLAQATVSLWRGMAKPEVGSDRGGLVRG